MNAHTLVFDKLIYLDRLKSAGVSDEVARAHADGLDQALRDSVATKSDLQALESRQDGKFDSLEKRIDALDAKIETSVARLETKIAEAQVTTTRWMIGTFIALGGLFWAIVKYSH